MSFSRDSLGLHFDLEGIASGIKKFAAAYHKLSGTVVQENSRMKRSTQSAFQAMSLMPNPSSRGRNRLDFEKMGARNLPTGFMQSFTTLQNLNRVTDQLVRKGQSNRLNASGKATLSSALMASTAAAKQLDLQFAKLGKTSQKALKDPIHAVKQDMADAAKIGAKLVQQTTMWGRLMAKLRGAGGGNGVAGGAGGGGGGFMKGMPGMGGYRDMAGLGLSGLLLDRLPAAMGRIGSGVDTMTGGNLSGTNGLLSTVDELNRTLHRTRGELFNVRRELVATGAQFGAVLNPSRISEATKAVVQSGFRSTQDIKANMQLVGLGAAATGAGADNVAHFTRMLQMGGMSTQGAAGMTLASSRLAERGGSSASELMSTSSMAQEGMGAALTNLSPQDQKRTLTSMSALQSSMTAQGISGQAAQEMVRKLSVAVSDVTSPEAQQIVTLTGMTGGDSGSLMAALRSGRGGEILKRIQGYGQRAGGSSTLMSLNANAVGMDSRSLSLLTKNGSKISDVYDEMAKSVENTADAMENLNDQGKRAQTTATSMANKASMDLLKGAGITALGVGHEANAGAMLSGGGNVLTGIGQVGLTLGAMKLGQRALSAMRRFLPGGAAAAGEGAAAGAAAAGEGAAGATGAARILGRLLRFGRGAAPLGLLSMAGGALTSGGLGSAKGDNTNASWFDPAAAGADNGVVVRDPNTGAWMPQMYSRTSGKKSGFSGLGGLYDDAQNTNVVAQRGRRGQAELHAAMLQAYQIDHPDATAADVNFSDGKLMVKAQQLKMEARGEDSSVLTDFTAPALTIDKVDTTNSLLMQILNVLNSTPMTTMNAQ